MVEMTFRGTSAEDLSWAKPREPGDVSENEKVPCVPVGAVYW